MIVYASRLQLIGANVLVDVRSAVCEWLDAKLRRCKSEEFLRSVGRHDLGDSMFLEVAAIEGRDREALGIRFGHPDNVVAGREWHTEVGVDVTPDASYCTVVLHAHDSSARVLTWPRATRPLVVQNIVKRCKLGRLTPSGVRRLTEVDADAFEYGVSDSARAFPIVQVSPLRNGGYPVDPQYLCDLLTGIAEVVLIPEDADTFAISNAVGARFSAYDGAVNILWPAVDRNGAAFVPSSRFLAADIERMRFQGLRPESELLATICHQTNAPLARAHLSPEQVHFMSLRSALESAAQATNTAVDAELRALYSQVDVEQRNTIMSLERTLQEQERQLTAARAECEERESTISALKYQLAQAGASVQTLTGIGPSTRAAIEQGMADDASLEDCLRVIEQMYPDRLVILPTAWKSAKDASAFDSPRSAFALLAKLCTGYYDAMSTGKGDRAGLDVFGNKSFAARESETVEKNRRARELRCFRYKGTEVEMMRHLKIGVKDSVDKTFRAHFHWDAEAKRIVLGHCGRHLDHG
jgi:hypothetical protein